MKKVKCGGKGYEDARSGGCTEGKGVGGGGMWRNGSLVENLGGGQIG